MDMIISDRFRLSHVASALLLLNAIGVASAAESKNADHPILASTSTTTEEDEEVEFNNIFLSNQPIDVSRFSKGNPVTAGKYNVAVMVNEHESGKFDIRFNDNPDDPLRALPCLTLKDMV